jgi:hypothetical protein
MAQPTAYDRVAYPTAVFAQTNPERLAVLAKLAGLDPVDPAHARILDVGGGDCMNLLSFAAIWPGCDAHGFDLSASAIAKGRRYVEASGLANVTLAVEDILCAREQYPARSFDYVIIHGVYAWVPPAVREACLALIEHVLSDRGVGFVSYNCMPGGHVRMIMREMLMQQIGGIGDPLEKVAAAQRILEEFAEKNENDDAIQAGLREHARSMLQRPDAVLFHDELGECYFPQRLKDVVEAAGRHGLRFLTDSGRNRQLDGFLVDLGEVPEDPDAFVVAEAAKDDYLAVRYFRQSLFVRQDAPVERALDLSRIADLTLSTKLKRAEDGSFVEGKTRIEIGDAGVADRLAAACAVSPRRVPVRDIAITQGELRIVMKLFNEWDVNLHPGEAPFASEPGEFPETSPLIRGMMALGDTMICTLDHNLLRIDQPELQRLLLACDGTRSIAELERMDHGIPGDQVRAALAACCDRALLVRR